MEKLQIIQVSGSSCASNFLKNAGFVSKYPDGSDCPYLYAGCRPDENKEFFVYYEEPENDEELFGGKFKLVRVDNNKEVTIDQGSATKSHFHGGLKSKTFYGKGDILSSWSLHCCPN